MIIKYYDYYLKIVLLLLLRSTNLFHVTTVRASDDVINSKVSRKQNFILTFSYHLTSIIEPFFFSGSYTIMKYGWERRRFVRIAMVIMDYASQRTSLTVLRDMPYASTGRCEQMPLSMDTRTIRCTTLIITKLCVTLCLNISVIPTIVVVAVLVNTAPRCNGAYGRFGNIVQMIRTMTNVRKHSALPNKSG